MRKILFSFLVSGISFAGIQGACATKVCNEKEKDKSSLAAVRKTPKTSKAPRCLAVAEKSCLEKYSEPALKKFSTNLLATETSAQEKQVGADMKFPLVPGLLFQQLINCVEKEHAHLEREDEKRRQSALSNTSGKIKKPQSGKSFIKVELQKGKLKNTGNTGRAFINRSGLICVVPTIKITFHR